MNRETRIDATKDGDEMVREGQNCFFCRVGAVHMRRDELVLDGVGLQVVFDIFRTLVVHDVHFGSQSSCFEVEVQCGVCFELFVHALVFKRCSYDGVQIAFVEYHSFCWTGLFVSLFVILWCDCSGCGRREVVLVGRWFVRVVRRCPLAVASDLRRYA